MRLRILMILGVTMLGAQSANAQKHEFAFTSGALKIGERGFDLASRNTDNWPDRYVCRGSSSFVVKTQVEFTIVINYAKPNELQPTLPAQEIALNFVTCGEIDNRL